MAVSAGRGQRRPGRRGPVRPARARRRPGGRRAWSRAACSRSRSARASTAAWSGRRWSRLDSREHTIEPSEASEMHSIGAIEPSSASHDLGHRDLRGGAREHVAAARAAPRVDEVRLAQARDEMLEVGQRQARRARRSPRAGSARRRLARASSTITRMPYSALVENIIARFPTCAARVSARLQLPDVVRERFGRELFRLEQHALAAPGVEQQQRRRSGRSARDRSSPAVTW